MSMELERVTSPVPDEVTPTIGWRAWHRGTDGELRSLNWDLAWPAREPMIATHRSRDFGGDPFSLSFDPTLMREVEFHTCDVANCSECGIYALAKARQLPSLFPMTPGGVVVGTVKLWGRIVEGEHGYRAEQAYPERLYLVARPEWDGEPEWHRHGRARLIATRYGVPCELISEAEFWRMTGSQPVTRDHLKAAYGSLRPLGIRISATSPGAMPSMMVTPTTELQLRRSRLIPISIALNLIAMAMNLGTLAWSRGWL